MKILFLNPKINAKHEIARSLLRKGVAFLFPESAEDALQMLEFHGDTIDLALIHREGVSGKDDSGLRFVEKLKLDSNYKDLPIVLTSGVWSDADCAEHQNGPVGVNAYLHSPFSESELVAICEAVLGQSIIASVTVAPTESPKSPIGSSLPVLEEASEVFKLSELKDVSAGSGISILLEDFGLELPQAETSNEPPDSSENFVVTGNAASETEKYQSVPNEQGSDSNSESVQIEMGSSEQEGLQVEGFPSEAGTREEVNAGNEELGRSEGFEVSEAPNMPNGALEVSSPPHDDREEQKAEEMPSEIEALPQKLESIERVGLEVLESFSLEGNSGDTPSLEDSKNPEPAVDAQVAEEMPYLAPGYSTKNRAAFDPSLVFAEALGDAVVPGGAAQAPDLETFKKYLMLREQDVAVLSNQLKAAHDQLAASEQLLKEERAKQSELTYIASEQKKKIEDFEKEKNEALDRLRTDVDELTFQLKTKTDKSRILDRQVRETVEEMEHLKTQVRTDIRKIRVREKELENRLEMNKKDSEALIAARENKIIELKRKLDVLEFNMDLLQDQYSREKESSSKLRERLIKAAQVVRVAGGLLDSNKEGRGSNEGSNEVSTEETSGEEGLKAS
jgi:CheY-like chemotaxis protein